jgi:hypothetical protein
MLPMRWLCMRRLPATLMALPLPCTRSATITETAMPPTPIAVMAISDNTRPMQDGTPEQVYQPFLHQRFSMVECVKELPGHLEERAVDAADGEIPLLYSESRDMPLGRR